METATFELLNEQLVLDPRKAIWWPAQQSLLIADLHLGKTSHFRRQGIPVPTGPSTENFQVFQALLADYAPKRVLFLGDLFHSEMNREWGAFGSVLRQYPSIAFELVEGNHDILNERDYTAINIQLHRGALHVGPFRLTHEPEEEPEASAYNLCGHLHPGVTMIGRGRQALRLPCFYFGKAQGILPAFGAFTGTSRILPKKTDRVFVVAEDRVVAV